MVALLLELVLMTAFLSSGLLLALQAEWRM
jgi:hypothetical protein